MSENKMLAPPDPKMVICGHSPVTALIFGPHETYKEQPVIFSGHQNGRIIEWSIVTQRARVSWPGHTEDVIWLALPVSDKLLSQGRDAVVRIWSRGELAAWISIGDVPCARLGFCDSAVIHHDRHFQLAVPGDESGQVDIHVIGESAWTSRLPATSATESCPIFSWSQSVRPSSDNTYGMCMRIRMFVSDSCGTRLLVAYENGALTLWEISSGALLSEVKAHDDTIMAMDCWVSQETSLVMCVTGSADEVLKSWQVEGDKLVNGTNISVTNPGISSIAVREDGRILATGGWDHRGRIFSLRKLKPLAVLMYHTGNVYCVSFAPDNTLATGSKDGYIALWDVYKNK